MMFRKEVLVLEVLGNNLGTWMNSCDVAHELEDRISQREVEAALALLVRTGHATSQSVQKRLVYREHLDYEGEGVKISLTEFQITNSGYQQFRDSQTPSGFAGQVQVPSFSI